MIAPKLRVEMGQIRDMPKMMFLTVYFGQNATFSHKITMSDLQACICRLERYKKKMTQFTHVLTSRCFIPTVIIFGCSAARRLLR